MLRLESLSKFRLLAASSLVCYSLGDTEVRRNHDLASVPSRNKLILPLFHFHDVISAATTFTNFAGSQRIAHVCVFEGKENHSLSASIRRNRVHRSSWRSFAVSTLCILRQRFREKNLARLLFFACVGIPSIAKWPKSIKVLRHGFLASFVSSARKEFPLLWKLRSTNLLHRNLR